MCRLDMNVVLVDAADEEKDDMLVMSCGEQAVSIMGQTSRSCMVS